MEKYTIEQLQKEGTDFKFPKNNNVKYFLTNCEIEKSICFQNDYTTFKSRKMGYIEFNEIEAVIPDVRYLVPISEFEKLGMIQGDPFPQYFAVRHDRSKEFEEYRKWLNNKFDVNWAGLHEECYYGYDSKGIISNGTFCSSIVYTDKKVKIFESAKEFMQLVNKQENNNKTMEKPKTFTIRGKKHQIDAISEDLRELGYQVTKSVLDNGCTTQIIHNKCIDGVLKSKSNFIDLYLSYANKEVDVEFNLPEDYSKALENAKLSINSPYWNIKKEEIVSVGGQFNVKITKEGIFHGGDNITEFVKKLVHNFILGQTFGGFEAKVKEVEFEKTGCQTKPTKLSDWKKVWEKYNEFI